jgi:GNAT superfamily N-acetyltransferase
MPKPPKPYRVQFAHRDMIAQLQALDPWPNERRWRGKIEEREVIVAVDNQRVAGLIRFEFMWTTVPWISMIFVNEADRGNGLSRAMLNFLIDHLRGLGHVALLSSSQTDEPAPQSWHRHMGFAENGIILNIADQDVGELVFRLPL